MNQPTHAEYKQSPAPSGLCLYVVTSAFSVASASGGNTSSPAAMFCRRCATEEVPGSAECSGERCSSEPAQPASVSPRVVRHRLQPGRLQRRKTAQREERHISNPLLRKRIHQRIVTTVHDVVHVCTHTTGTIFCASATCVAVTLLRPICRTSPCCCSSAGVDSGSAIEPSAGPCALNIIRRFTTSSTSSCRLRRLSCTAGQLPAEKAAAAPLSSRRAPILVTRVRSSRYGCSASRISWLVTCGP